FQLSRLEPSNSVVHPASPCPDGELEQPRTVKPVASNAATVIEELFMRCPPWVLKAVQTRWIIHQAPGAWHAARGHRSAAISSGSAISGVYTRPGKNGISPGSPWICAWQSQARRGTSKLTGVTAVFAVGASMRN